MTIRVLIVDDEQLALDRLCDLLGDLEDVEIVGTATTAAKAKEAIATNKPDLVLLDIQMPGGSGMAMAADLPIEGRPELVFVTAFEHYAPDAFEVDAADYLLKPVRFDRLRQAITRTKRRIDISRAAETGLDRLTDKSQYIEEIWVSVRGGQVRLGVDHIEWIEAAKDYVLLHTSIRSYLHRISMASLESVLNPHELTRVHRSAFVRLSQVERLERPGKGSLNLVLRDGALVQVGPSYVKAVLERLSPRAN